MKKLICILLAAATAAGCEKDDPTRYDMSQGRVCFPGAAPNETAEYPGYSNSDSTFYASMTFKQQPEGVAEAVIEVPVKLIGGAPAPTVKSASAFSKREPRRSPGSTKSSARRFRPGRPTAPSASRSPNRPNSTRSSAN